MPEPDVRPSSTPDGPQVVPAPSTPPGEPGPDPDPEVTGSDPNAGGSTGLAGAMGVSSERVPLDPGSIEGTGSRGTATSRTNGTWATLGGGSGSDEQETDDRPHPQEPAEGPEMDDRQQQATQEWRENQPAVNVDPDPAGG